MEMQKEEAKMLQWHPAFFAEIQIELQEDAEHLIFENEHQLGTKPKEIDVLIIKKDKGRVIRKNIGRIFRQRNIVEYKSPLDYLSIDDFYKVYGYTCFYKSDTSQMDSIPIEELTITLVTGKYPRKLMHHLKTTLRYQVKKAESGIYYVAGDKIPIQIIVTKELELRPEGLSTTGTIEKSGSTADFVNTYSKYGYITVIKELAGDETAYPDDKEFKFNITPPGGSAGNYDTEIAVTAGDPSGVKLKVEPEDKDKAFTITEADTKGAWRTTAQVGTEAEKNAHWPSSPR